MISVKIESSATLRDLERIAGRQFPYAFAKTLTDLAKGGRDEVRQQTRSVFDLHTDFIPRGITIKAASKNEIKARGTSEALVYTRPKISEWMPRHEFGIDKEPSATGANDKGRMLALPGRDLRKMKYKTATGRVKKRWKPSTLLEGYNQISPDQARITRGSREKIGNRTPFITKIGGGFPAIVRRKSARRRYPLQILWVFVPRAEINDSWRFKFTLRQYVGAHYADVFERNVRSALASAK